ncbi:tetratricopeptide repeat-containing sulfotransferase family protein [Sphingomonas mesophila]|uniref:tetratricopeptide repeat-containing sulfotransferase family protein n=1 Tax=Sphingomonas mesophila TaxID=2303576 RepID=UPI000E57571C|nr:sulfotransferase [Sphingomonas mesophila]
MNFERQIAAAKRDRVLLQAGGALRDNDLPTAETLLRTRLKQRPTDVAAIRMMAELAARIGRLGDAENLLRRAVELAPAFSAARANLATVLYKLNRPVEAIAELDRIAAEGAANPSHSSLKAAALGRIGGHNEALELYSELIGRFPDQPKLWMSYGHILKTVGRLDDGIAAYRRALEVQPTLGEVWWSLANLKTVAFSAGDVAAMERALDDTELTSADRFHLHFALGKALEDAGEAAGAFGHYAEGNRLRGAEMDYDPGVISDHVERSIALFTPDFFSARGGGCARGDPIFIVGLPRAGSTLIEQILSSHPEVEGTTELPDIPTLARRLGGRKRASERSLYPEILAELDPDELRALGEEYLERAQVQRSTDRPLFIDKLPNNWAHVGFIRLILPSARIIDARRHPLACGFSNFKQHFARGQGFTYDLADLGRYYRDYVTLMRHFDAVIPGHVHRVIHEELVDDPEREIRAMLDYLGLPFDARCLTFHENRRAVRTPSAEQVRRPISRAGLDQWRAFAPWLGPLEAALGEVLHDWRH